MDLPFQLDLQRPRAARTRQRCPDVKLAIGMQELGV